MEKVIVVEGMKCPHCEMYVKEALEKVDGVKEASADRNKKEARVILTHAVDDKTLLDAINLNTNYHAVSVK